MLLENTFTIPVSVDEAWPLLLDVERMARCLPGASLESVDGDLLTGRVTVKLGPITVKYKGKAEITSRDPQARLLGVAATGRESRGSGSVRAEILTSLEPQGEATQVAVKTDLDITGRPAQFGRGVLNEVAARIVDQFATRLHEELSATGQDVPDAAGSPPSDGLLADGGRQRNTRVPTEVRPAAQADAVDLVPLLRPYLVKAAVALVPVLVLVVATVRRRRSASRRFSGTRPLP